MTTSMTESARPGSFAPCASAVFAVLWAATVLGNTGSFMRDVASAWLVTDLSPLRRPSRWSRRPATLPIFLLAIPAGVLSDILDRRKFLIAIQLLLGRRSASPDAAVADRLADGRVRWSALTFLGGVGAALMGPTWQAIVPELVPRSRT